MLEEIFRENVILRNLAKLLKDFDFTNMFTVWKFKDFSITQIIHEIGFGESVSSKTAGAIIFLIWKVLINIQSLQIPC